MPVTHIRKAGKSIASRVAWAAAILVVASAGSTAVVFSLLENRGLERLLVDRQGFSARQGAAALDHELRFATEELEHVARRISRSLPTGQELLHAQRELTVFFNGRVFFMNELGQCQAAVPTNAPCTGVDISEQPWFRRARRTLRSQILFGIDDDAEAHIDLIVPVHDETGFHGLLRGEILLSQKDLIRDESVSGPAGLPHALALLGSDGTVLFSDGDTGLSADAWTEIEPGAHLITDAPTRLVVARAELTGLDASLLYVWRFEDLDRGALERRSEALVALLVLTIAGAFVGWLAGRQLVRPVLALAKDMQAFTKDGTALPSSKSHDEVDQLRNAFGRLVRELAQKTQRAEDARDELMELTASLESRVEERTRSLEETQAALVAAERLATLGRAGATLSHELRNALNGLSLGFDALGSGLSSDAAATVRRELRHEIARLRNLADTLLDFAADRRAKRRDVDLRILFERCAVLTQDKQDHPVNVRWDVMVSSVANVDGDLLQSIITNLVINAQRAGATEVTVSAEERDDRCFIRVDDNGPGIDPEVHPKVFEPFISGRVGGVGLGLAISHRFAEMHGGTLTTAEGTLGGACFELDIPHAFGSRDTQTEKAKP